MSSFFQRLSALWKKPQPAASAPAPAPVTATEPVATPGNNEHEAVCPEQGAGHAQFVNEELIYTVLRTCYDPEIPLNIVDLGLIYGVQVADDRVSVKMTLTTQGCGMGSYISREAEEKILSLPGVREARVEVVWDPPWTPDMISAEGRKTLGLPE
ncbi:MAG TPA: iron-sulfur cluster assembly protein [Methylomirabilota bacterium]|nr:iron-sulfur cluster assembly protein [Methylomirabilota bacterium]